MRGAEAAIAHDEIEVGAVRGEDGIEVRAHGPAARDAAAARLEPVPDGADAAVHGEVERRCSEHVDAKRGRGFILHEAGEAFLAEPSGNCRLVSSARLWQGLAGEVGELLQGEVDAALVVVHAVRRQGEGGDAGLLLEDAADSAAVSGDHMGNLGGNQADKARLELFGCCFDICDEFGVVAEDGVLLGQDGDEDLARLAEPARFVVCRVRRVAARGVVDDDHAAELVERGADAEGIGGVGGEDAGSLFHNSDGPPNPLRRTFASMSLGSR